MEYTVQKLGKLAGISSRTIRYYDEKKKIRQKYGDYTIDKSNSKI